LRHFKKRKKEMNAMKRSWPFFMALLPLLGGIFVTPLASLADSAGPVGKSKFTQRDGAALYQHACQGCHMKGGEGAVGAGSYPALANNADLGDASTPIYFVLNGHGAMPGFGGALDDEQVAAVVNYVCSNFGNHSASPATVAEVKSARISGATYFSLD
jgi:mono/diheme cytochrome c family protein